MIGELQVLAWKCTSVEVQESCIGLSCPCMLAIGRVDKTHSRVKSGIKIQSKKLRN
jgi:hypothetical protein